MHTPWFGTVLAVAALAGSGYLHGLWTGRFAPGVNLDRVFVARLDGLAPTLGGWQGGPVERETNVPPGDITYFRRYRHAATGRSVLMTVTLGKPNRVCIHTPDMCYPASGYEVLDEPATRELPRPSGGLGRFRTATFHKKGAAGLETQRVSWAWGGGASWDAPDFPRLNYAREPYLLKLYVIHPKPAGEDEAALYDEFAGLLTDDLDRTMFPR